MNLRLCIVTATPKLALDAIATARANADNEFDVCLYTNGCEITEGMVRNRSLVGDVRIDGSPSNAGVTAGLHRIWEMCKASGVHPGEDILFYIHDDVAILESGWDSRVKSRYEASPKCALTTFGGAKGLGTPELYREPYAMHQLARRRFMSNMGNAEAHGERATHDQLIATPDGFSMGLRRGLLDQIDGWSWFPYPHHSYDNSIACQTRRHGWEAWLVPVECEHYGGLTATKGVYQEFADKFGGDVRVHADGHEWMYEEFRDVLPFGV